MDPQLSVLISRMVEELPRALSELNRNGRKSSHWAWWAWPTEKEGYSEPPPRTAVSRSTAKELLRSAPKVWEQVLCKVAELIEANGGSMEQIIPSIDWGRIHYFVKFWEQQPDLPPWLETRVLPILKQANIDEEAGVSDAGLVLSKKTKFQKDEHVGGSKEAAEEISKAKAWLQPRNQDREAKGGMGAKMEQHCEDNESTAKDRRSRDKKNRVTVRPIRGDCVWDNDTVLKTLDLEPFKNELKGTLLALHRTSSTASPSAEDPAVPWLEACWQPNGLTASLFNLSPTLAAEIAALKSDLQPTNRGAAIVKNIAPASWWSDEELEELAGTFLEAGQATDRHTEGGLSPRSKEKETWKQPKRRMLEDADRKQIVQRASSVIFAGLNAHIGSWVPQEQPEGPAGAGHGGALLVSQLGTLRVRDYNPPKRKRQPAESATGGGKATSETESATGGGKATNETESATGGGKATNETESAVAVKNERDGSIQMHCDANTRCDVVTMLLLQPPASGGKARVCSAARVHNTLLKVDQELCERLRTRPLFSLYNPESGDSGGDAALVFSVVEANGSSASSSSSASAPSAAPVARLTTRLVSKKRFGVGLRKSVRESLDESTRAQLFDQNERAASGNAKTSTNNMAAGRGVTTNDFTALKKALNVLENVAKGCAVEFDMEPHMAYYANNHTVYHGRSEVVRGYQRLLVRQHLAFHDNHPTNSSSSRLPSANTMTTEQGRPLSAHRRRIMEAQQAAAAAAAPEGSIRTAP